jgi:hypothetical protein
LPWRSSTFIAISTLEYHDKDTLRSLGTYLIFGVLGQQTMTWVEGRNEAEKLPFVVPK